MNNRYVVDVRVGCVGIRDTFHPTYPSSPGLGLSFPDVVDYRPLGRKDLRDEEIIKSNNKLCDELNKNNKYSKEDIIAVYQKIEDAMSEYKNMFEGNCKLEIELNLQRI